MYERFRWHSKIPAARHFQLVYLYKCKGRNRNKINKSVSPTFTT